MAWSRVQSCVGSSASAASVAATFTTANLSSGTVLVAAVVSTSTVTISNVKDGSGNAFSLVGSKAGTNVHVALYMIATPAGDVGTKPTITATLSASAQPSAILVQEVSGIAAAADGTLGSNSGAGGSSTGSPVYSSTASSEYLISVYGDNGGPETWTKPAALTADANSINANGSADLAIAYGNSTGGTESGSWSLSGTAADWATLLVALKLSGTSVALTTPNVALAAPVPGIATTIALTTPNVALAAPVLSPFPFDVLPSVKFPAQPLDERVELLLNGTWTDVSAYVEHDPTTVQRGHPDESTTTAPTVVGLTLQNGDGRFTEGNPLSPYYPYLRRNTPCRISLPEGASYLRLEGDSTSYVQGPATANIAGDLEIQLDVTLDNWNAAQLLASKYNFGSERSWQLVMVDDSATLSFIVSADGASSTLLTATAAVPLPPLLRQCIRVTYQASTATATFYTSPPGLSSPVWTQVGAAVSAGTTVTPFSSTSPILLGYGLASTVANGINGKIHAFLLLNGIGGSTVADPDFTAQVAGATSFTDGQGNTWTLAGTAEISDRNYRAHVEIPQWAHSQDPSGHSVHVKVQGGGPLRRLGMGQTPALSPMTRAGLRSRIPLAAYWPAEDGSSSVTAASALGGTPLVAAGLGVPAFASNSDFACSQPIPVMNGGTFYGTVTTPAGFTWTDNMVRFLVKVPAGDDTNGAVMAQFTTTGTCALIQVVYGTGGNLTLNVYSASGSLIGSSSGGAGTITLGAPSVVEVAIRAAGTVGANVQVIGQNIAIGPGVAFTGTVGAVMAVQFGGGLTGTAMGQFAVAPSNSDSILVGATISALTAWNGETAADRFARLCSEENISCRIRGQASATPAMGVQTVQTITQLLQECVDADLGMWTEPRQQLGFGYRTRASIGNMAAAVTVSFDADHMDVWSSDPTADDQIIVNDVTVSQPSGGSSAHVVADTGQPVTGGTMGVTAVGRYDQSYTVNVQTARLTDNAGWRVHMGTVDEPRYPGIAIDLANMALYQQGLLLPLLDMDLGDRLTMQFPPGYLPPGAGDQIDQVMNGVLETMKVARMLGQQWQGIPYAPWPQFVCGDPVYGRAGTAGSQLASGITSAQTSITVTTTTGPVWIDSGTFPSDFPFTVLVGGEACTVTAISGTSSPQTFTVTRSVNGVAVAWPAGTAVSLAYPAIAGM